MRKAIELYLRDTRLPVGRDSVIQALNHIIPAMNTLSFTKGYTPSQWVLNTNPTDHASIIADQFNPAVHHTAITEQGFHDELVRRNTARIAFLKADASQRIRRALLRRHRELDMVLAVEKVFTGY